jgi:hypothetical protein
MINETRKYGEIRYLNTVSLAHEDNYDYDDYSDRMFNNIMEEFR